MANIVPTSVPVRKKGYKMGLEGGLRKRLMYLIDGLLILLNLI